MFSTNNEPNKFFFWVSFIGFYLSVKNTFRKHHKPSIILTLYWHGTRLYGVNNSHFFSLFSQKIVEKCTICCCKLKEIWKQEKEIWVRFYLNYFFSSVHPPIYIISNIECISLFSPFVSIFVCFYHCSLQWEHKCVCV